MRNPVSYTSPTNNWEHQPSPSLRSRSWLSNWQPRGGRVTPKEAQRIFDVVCAHPPLLSLWSFCNNGKGVWAHNIEKEYWPGERGERGSCSIFASRSKTHSRPWWRREGVSGVCLCLSLVSPDMQSGTQYWRWGFLFSNKAGRCAGLCGFIIRVAVGSAFDAIHLDWPCLLSLQPGICVLFSAHYEVSYAFCRAIYTYQLCTSAPPGSLDRASNTHC
ncbi:hypothetical protein V8C44DRAFT_169587 [Trichoderma aethiopicum]